MKLFEIKNNQPIVTTEGIMTFKELYDRDTSKDKSRFFQELEYVYFLTDYRSYYLSYPSEEQEQQVIKDYIKIDNWKPDEIVKRAIVKYKALQKTESLGLLEDARFALEKIRGYYKSIDFNKRDTKGNQLFKITDVTRSIGDISKMIESLEKLKEKVVKEEELNSKVRGGAQGGYFEDN